MATERRVGGLAFPAIFRAAAAWTLAADPAQQPDAGIHPPSVRRADGLADGHAVPAAAATIADQRALRHRPERGEAPRKIGQHGPHARTDLDRAAVGGHRVGLFRVEDDLYALADRCPHRGAPLCAGTVATPIETRNGAVALGKRRSVVRCPWHRWEFEIATGACLVDERLRVRRYGVRIDRDEIVVSLDRPT